MYTQGVESESQGPDPAQGKQPVGGGFQKKIMLDPRPQDE